MIDVNGLTKRFGSVPALSELTFRVEQGSTFALLGPNGAGKSTALRILLNIVRADSGIAEVLGKDTRRLGPDELARIGYVSENRELPEWMTVAMFFRYCRRFYPAWEDSVASELARMFQLPLDRRISGLSRGMRMKAALTSALAYRPRLLILDEPFSGLDVVVREQLLESIAERTSECTVLVATHDLTDIEGFATHVGYLSEGKLLFAEEMERLSARFREVEVVSPEGAWDSVPLPPNWLNVKHSPGVVRFTDSEYQAQQCESEIRQRWPHPNEIAVRALPLRSILIALAGTQVHTR